MLHDANDVSCNYGGPSCVRIMIEQILIGWLGEYLNIREGTSVQKSEQQRKIEHMFCSESGHTDASV
jgi:hypothetical protein